MKKAYQITEDGKVTLEQELDELKGRRGDIAEKIAAARDFGDLSENAEYDAAKAGGTDILYNNRAFILHPNGLSFDADKINKETPTDAEFTTSTNWRLKFDHKNVRMGKITIPKANFAEA